jgi:class 3 adenylate cyclase/tetratricopeptide (TPR) repeat protein
MQCPNCQFDNRDGVNFCEKCGANLEQICPNCNATIPPDRIFCGICGHNLTDSSEITSIDYSKPQSYTPKFLADKILTSRSSVEGERKLVTVLFADVANFTAISELLDPEDIHQIINGTFQILMNEIHSYEGTINQFTGDGVMALFGAPVAHEDHAQRACLAAISTQRALQGYSQQVKANHNVDFALRIGLNSGPVVVGSIGDDLRMDYTAVGNTTNLADRMQGLAKPGSILLSYDTHRLVADFFEFEYFGSVKVKGIKAPQEIFQLIKPSAIETRIGASVARGLKQFVGRKNSMARLMEVYERIQSGAGQIIGVVGEAGVGKSRLLLEFNSLLSQGEFIYLEGRCLPYGGSMSYLPMLEIIKSFFGIKEDNSESAIKAKLKEKISTLDENLQATIPSFQDLLSLKADSDDFTVLDPQQKRELTFVAMRDLFLHISHDLPLIIAVEDLHWIDKTSENFLNFLIGGISTSRILIILLYRPEYTHQWGSKSDYSQIGLKQLGIPSSIQLIKTILESEEISQEIEKLVLHRTAGNPLFIEEFTQMLIEDGAIQQKGSQYILNRNASDIQVPETIQGLIAARIDRLEDDIKNTLQVASVIGRDFAYHILQTITGMSEELKSYLFNLQDLEFIYEKENKRELEYIFKHALTQEVAYLSLLTARRKILHRMVGQAMEAHFGERLNEYSNIIGEHFMRGEDWGKAYHYLNQAGDAAIRLYAHSEARAHFTKSLNALSHMEDTKENQRRRVDTIINLTVSSWLTDRADVSIERLDMAEDLIRSLLDSNHPTSEDTTRLARIQFWIGRAYYQRGEMREALGYYQKVLPIAQQTGDAKILAIPSGAIGQVLVVQGHLENGSALLGQAIELFEKLARWPEWIQAKSFYGAALAGMGKYNQGLCATQDALSKSQEFQSFTGISVSQLCSGFVYFFVGDLPKAIDAAKAAVNSSMQSGDLIYLYVGYGLLAWSSARSGRKDLAYKSMNQSQEVAHQLGGKVIMGDVFQSARAEMAYLIGDMDTAIQTANQTIEMAQKIGAIWSTGVSYRVWGQALYKSELQSWEETGQKFAESIHILESGQNQMEAARTHFAWGQLYYDLGNADEARVHLEQAAHKFSESNANKDLENVKELLALL